MRKKFIFIGLAAGCVVTGGRDASAAIGFLDMAVNPANNHTYYLLPSSSWTEAEAVGLQLGGHLVTINDQAENDWVYNRWGTDRTLWIGLNDASTEGAFVWSSGEAVGFTNWRRGEPNDGGTAGPSEDYVYIHPVGYGGASQWNDWQDEAYVPGEPDLFGVVEVNTVPEPNLSFWFLSGCGLWLLRRGRMLTKFV